jgi:hypothetical protein
MLQEYPYNVSQVMIMKKLILMIYCFESYRPIKGILRKSQKQERSLTFQPTKELFYMMSVFRIYVPWSIIPIHGLVRSSKMAIFGLAMFPLCFQELMRKIYW